MSEVQEATAVCTKHEIINVLQDWIISEGISQVMEGRKAWLQMDRSVTDGPCSDCAPSQMECRHAQRAFLCLGFV